MIGRTNAVSKPGVELSLVVSVTSGAAVTATKGSKTVNGTAAGGSCVLSLPEAGTWSVKATLNGQTSDTKSVSVVDSYAVALTFFSATITVNVDSGASVTLKKGGTTIATKTSNGTAVFTVTETGAYTVTATKNGQTTSGSVNVVSGTTSYSLTLSFVSSTLNNNEWSVIKSVSDAGQGANYWSIGDRKAVTLNGTVGKLSLSNVTTYAFIIGFNHNASVEGANRIHFQLAKTALSGGTDVCFCDNQYGPDSGWSSPGAGYFVMNASNTNSGGWKSSQMRTAICGTSLSSYSGTIIAVIPAALRAVLKSVTKYTDNTGGGSTAASNVTATTDYFFLLSEFEVFGSISYGNTNEKNKQAQYAYYSAGNSKIKYKHNGTSTAAIWWLRSPSACDSSVSCVCTPTAQSTTASRTIPSASRPAFAYNSEIETCALNGRIVGEEERKCPYQNRDAAKARRSISTSPARFMYSHTTASASCRKATPFIFPCRSTTRRERLIA